jgi:hypothetical protein
MPMGYSFQPGADQPMGAGNGQTGRSVPAPASSVKTLSFRMPKQNVQGAIAPAALLNATGAGGAQTGGLSPQLLSLLLSAFSAGPSQSQGYQPPSNYSNDPAGVVGPSPSFGPPKFTIGDGRLPFDLGPMFAAGPGSGEIPGGMFSAGPTPTATPDRTAVDRSGVGHGPRYKMIDDSLSLPFGQSFDMPDTGRMFF